MAKLTQRIAEKVKVRNIPAMIRQNTLGIIFLLGALFIWLVFVRTTTADMQTLFVMTPGGSISAMPNITFNSLFVLKALAIICAILGVYQIVRGFGKSANLVLGIVGVLLTTSFLAWGASGGSINVGGMLRVMVLRSVPITLGAMAGILCERVGVVNIAIEGMMITGALVGAIFGSLWGLWVGMLAAIIAGGLTAVVLGILSIKYKVNQVISGTIINIFTIGLTSYIVTKILQVTEWQYLNQSGFFQPIHLPILSKIPYIGPILFSHNIYIYFMYMLDHPHDDRSLSDQVGSAPSFCR